jgi:hypothetical protein
MEIVIREPGKSPVQQRRSAQAHARRARFYKVMRVKIVLQAGTLLWQEQFSARALVLRDKRPMGHLSAPATLTTSQLLDAAASHVMKTSSSMGISMNA